MIYLERQMDRSAGERTPASICVHAHTLGTYGASQDGYTKCQLRQATGCWANLLVNHQWVTSAPTLSEKLVSFLSDVMFVLRMKLMSFSSQEHSATGIHGSKIGRTTCHTPPPRSATASQLGGYAETAIELVLVRLLNLASKQVSSTIVCQG